MPARPEPEDGHRPRFNRLWRRTVDLLASSLFILAAVLIAAAVWAAAVNVVTRGWSSDAAAWVQAAGSIAAIVGAAWMSRSELRRSRRWRREQNEEAAWHVRFAVRQAQLESQIVAYELVSAESPIGAGQVRDWRLRTRTAAVSLAAFLTRIDHVHPSVVQVLSNAKMLMDELLADLDDLGDKVRQESVLPDDLKDRIVGTHQALTELLDLYDTRMHDVRLTLDDAGDAFPIRWRAG